MGELDAVSSDRIEVWSPRFGIAVSAEMVRPGCIESDQEDIQPVISDNRNPVGLKDEKECAGGDDQDKKSKI